MEKKDISFLGLVGGSCSGKTTLRRHIIENYGGLVEGVNFDDFIKPIDPSQWKAIDDWENPDLYDFILFSQCLDDLRNGKVFEWRSYSWESYQSGNFNRIVHPKKNVLVEGFLICHDPSIRPKFNQIIFLDLPDEQIIERRLHRGEAGASLSDMQYIERYLLPAHRKYVLPQKTYATKILNGAQPPEKLVSEMLEILSIS